MVVIEPIAVTATVLVPMPGEAGFVTVGRHLALAVALLE
jgi:hypothetical protein